MERIVHIKTEKDKTSRMEGFHSLWRGIFKVFLCMQPNNLFDCLSLIQGGVGVRWEEVEIF